MEQWKVIPVSFLDPTVIPGVQLVLDSEKNEEKTIFQPGSDVWLKLFCDDPLATDITFKCSNGTVSIQATGLPMAKEEEISFMMTSEATLQYLPDTAVSVKWIGTDGGTPSFAGRRVTIPEKAVGILECKYTTLWSSVKCVPIEALDTLVCVFQNGGKDCLTFEVEEAAGPTSYELEVRDYCSNNILGGVTVYFDGKNMGQTDSNGVIYLGELLPGSSHSLKMTKTDYIDSDKDKLNNDLIEIPA